MLAMDPHDSIEKHLNKVGMAALNVSYPMVKQESTTGSTVIKEKKDRELTSSNIVVEKDTGRDLAASIDEEMGGIDLPSG
jgi:hypothetical protein